MASLLTDEPPPPSLQRPSYWPRRRFVARWDLDKTYLRTDFDTIIDLVRTAIERPDQKRTVPGAAALLRELGRAGVETHILSGSPEQLRHRIEEKLRLDGVKWASLTLKPNLQNMLRLRFRALRGQLGYKLPSLLLRRAELAKQRDESGNVVREALLGDDAEADAFVYMLYADACRGRIDAATLEEVLRRGGAYPDAIRDALRFLAYVERGEVVERILIHLERQSAPSDFRIYGPLVVPFYNYLQVRSSSTRTGGSRRRAFSPSRPSSRSRTTLEPGALARSYADLARRGHVTGAGIAEIDATFSAELGRRRLTAASELRTMIEGLRAIANDLPRETEPRPRDAMLSQSTGKPDASLSESSGKPGASLSESSGKPSAIDYLAIVEHHNPRRAADRSR